MLCRKLPIFQNVWPKIIIFTTLKANIFTVFMTVKPLQGKNTGVKAVRVCRKAVKAVVVKISIWCNSK